MVKINEREEDDYFDENGLKSDLGTILRNLFERPYFFDDSSFFHLPRFSVKMPTMIDDDDEDYDDEFDSDEGDEEDEDEEDDEDEPLDPWYSRAWTYVNQSRAVRLVAK